jgi:hypothetical protein
LYYDNSKKLATTSTGVDITGTLTSDGLTVDGDANLSGTAVNFDLDETDTTDLNTRFRQSAGQLFVQTANDAKSLGFNRLNINHSTGDISFYEDTGTTPKFFWDASAESLGLGATSFAGETLRMERSGDMILGLFSGASNGTFLNMGTTSNRDIGQIGYTQSTNHMFFRTNDAERMRIDSSGNVLVNDGYVKFSENSSVAYIGASNTLVVGGSASDTAIRYDSSNLVFSYSSSEKMRIDSSGNLLVGKTSANIATSGVELKDGNNVSTLNVTTSRPTANSGQVALFNRLSTDGDILDFRKDGSTVGSIGTLFGDIYLGTGNTGLKFTDSSSLIVPLNTSTLAERDAAVSLGQSSTRFKDLYLSGGVYLGGTGSANKLDDYEEGTFTPSVAVGSVTAASGYYTKIGRQVTIHMKLSQGFNTTNNENQFFQNLPFTSDQHDIAVGSAMMSRADSANRFGTAYMTTNSRIALYSASETGDFDSFRCIDLNSSNAIIYIYASYLAQT